MINGAIYLGDLRLVTHPKRRGAVIANFRQRMRRFSPGVLAPYIDCKNATLVEMGLIMVTPALAQLSAQSAAGDAVFRRAGRLQRRTASAGAASHRSAWLHDRRDWCTRRRSGSEPQ